MGKTRNVACKNSHIVTGSENAADLEMFRVEVEHKVEGRRNVSAVV